MTKLKITYRDPASLTPYADNPRENDNAVPYLMNSIERYGFLIPVVVDKHDVIVAGHTRVKAAMELGLKEVPVICAADLTPEKVDEFRLIDNKISELSWWNQDKLKLEMDKLDLAWEDYGFEPMIMPDDLPVWDGPVEEEEAGGDTETDDQPAYTAVEGGCRLLVTVPESMDPDGIVELLKGEGCRVKVMD